MKIQLSKNIFSEKLTQASRFTSTKFSSVTTISGVLIEGEGKKLHLYATTLTSYFHTLIKVEEDLSFSCIIDPKKILEFLNFLNPSPIILEFKEKEVLIIQGKTKAGFPLMNPEDFPKPPDIKGETQKIPTQVFIQDIPLVLFAASHDETRPVLNGVNFLTDDEEFMIVATDGFRLSLLKGKKEISFPQMLIPRDFLNEVIRFMRDEKEVVFGYSSEEKAIMFQVSDNKFYSRLIEGDFPPFNTVVPTEKKTTVVLDREEFLRNIKLVSVFARDSSNIIVVDCKKDGLYLRPKTEIDGENEAFQEYEFTGDEQKIAFNFKFLIELLNTIPSKQVTMEILRPDAPIVFRTNDKKNFIHIIMPIRIQQ